MLLYGLSPSCVMGYIREMHRFLDWLSTIRISVCDATGLVLVAYIRNVSYRGVSIPVKVRCALVWASSSYGLAYEAKAETLWPARMPWREPMLPDSAEATLVRPPWSHLM